MREAYPLPKVDETLAQLKRKVDEINAECLKHIEGTVHEYVAIDTDTNGEPLREADRQRLSRTATCLPDVLTLKESC